MSEPSDQSVDLTKQDTEAVARSVELYDPRPGRDRLRARVTGWLIAFVGILTTTSYVAVIAGFRSVDDIAKLQGLVVAPVMSMATAVIAFYFAQQHDPP